MIQRECPSEQELTRFLLGETLDSSVDIIAEHLEECPRCEQIARRLDNLTDSAILALRRSDLTGMSRPMNSTSPPGGRSAVRVPSAVGFPEALHDYEIQGELGRGGMGVVYKAWQISLRRTVALKMLLGSRFTDAQTRARFRSEAEAIARLQHPHIVQIFQIGEADGQPFFTMEYVDGGGLDEFVGKPQSPRESAAWLETLARTVDYAHEKGIVHRDLKPDNVLMSQDGQLKVTDFGVAKLLEGSDVQTASGLIVGTAEYMAPEQADARRDVGPPADIYSLGVILYNLLTGRPPFQAESVLETLEQVKFHEPVGPRQLRPQLPRDLETICLKCLEKEPRNRYASAGELADDLERFLKGHPIYANPVGWGTRLWRWMNRNRTVAFLMLAVATLLILVAAGAMWETHLAQERAGREIEARENLERQLYHTYIALAERECSANNMRRVDQLLAACRPDLRGWEWHYLAHRRHEKDKGLESPRGTRIQSIAYSPDGKYLAVTAPGLELADSPMKSMHRLIPQGKEGKITLWNLKTQKQGRILSGPDGRTVWSLAFNSDGGLLASAGSDNAVWIWDVNTGKPKHTLRGHQRPVRAIAFHPQRNLLASAGEDAAVKIWDAAKGEVLHTLDGHQSPVRGVAFSPDGRTLASTSNDQSVILWDLESYRTLLTLSGHTSSVRSVAFSPDGKRLATTSLGIVKLWDAKTGNELASLEGHSEEVIHAAFSPDGSRLATGGSDRTVRLWDTETGKETLTLHGHRDTVFSVAFSPDGRRLASAGWGGKVFFWDATPLSETPEQTEFTIAAHHGQSVVCVAISPNSERLASAGLDCSVGIWDRNSGSLLHRLEGFPQPVASLVFSPDGEHLVTLDGSGQALFWDAETGKKTGALAAHPNWGTAVSFSPDGKYFATACRSGTAQVWNADTQELVQSVHGRSGWISGLAIDHKSRRLAAGNDDGTAQIWDIKTGKELVTLGRNSLAITGVAFSPDGNYLAACSRDETINVWSSETGYTILLLEGHTDRVYDVCYRGDGRRIASAGGDETVRIWDAKTGRELHVLRGHSGIVESVEYSPDGNWLATGSRDGTLKIWPAPD